MAKKRIERACKSGQFAKKGTEKRRPAHTVTEPRHKPKKKK